MFVRLCSLIKRLILFYDISRDHVIKGSFVSFVVFLLLGYLLTNDFSLIIDNAGIGVLYMFSNAAVQSCMYSFSYLILIIVVYILIISKSIN